jgi:hypothetical protein
MKTAPDENSTRGARLALEEAFGILVLRGKALVIAKANAGQLAREIYLNQRMRDINQKQAAKLAALDGALTPASIKQLDRSKIDLIGLTGQLQFLRKQMLAMLAKSFALQDRALQYQNLQAPTPIESFSLLDFKGAVARQQTAATRAKSKLKKTQPSITKPMRYEIAGVPAEEITGGKQYHFAITPDAQVLLASKSETDGVTEDWAKPVHSTMNRYATVKVLAVVASLEGAAPFGEEEYQVKLEYLGNPFTDRDLEGNPRYFRTPSRSRVYEYLTKGNQPKFSDSGESWSDGVSPVTPFSTWAISLPKMTPDKAVQLAGGVVTIRLTFVLEARVLPKLKTLVRGAELRAGAAPMKEDVLAKMAAQGSALNGWDVVFNMSLDQINKSLAAQYEELKTSTAYSNRLKIETKVQRRARTCDVTKFQIEYGYPKLEFLTNNTKSVQLQMQILKGSIQTCDFAGKCEDVKEGDLDCDQPVNVTGETLTATVPIQLIEGKVQPQQPGSKTYSVVVDLAKGAFEAEALKLSDEQKVEFNKAVKAYFVNNPVKFLLNSLDLSNVSTLDSLRPNQFLFKNLKTPADQRMLQLFINAGSRAALDESQTFLNNVPEPIPYGYQCSLMISSKVFFGSVLPASTSGWKLNGVGDSKETTKAWQATFVSGQLTGSADFSAANHSIPGMRPGFSGDNPMPCYTLFMFSKSQSLSWPVDGMTLKPGSNGVMELSWQKLQKTSIEANVIDTCGSWPAGHKAAFSSDVTISASAKLPIAVEGKGRNQTLKIAVNNQSINVSGHMSGGGPCGCDDLQARLNSEIKKQIPSQMVNQLSVSFGPVSLFALKNLLFPSKNYISLAEAYVPGDLLILGNFTTES